MDIRWRIWWHAIDLNTIIGGLTRGDFSHPLFVLAQSPWFDFETHQSKWTLDGEYGGTQDHVKIQVVPNAINIAMPPKQDKNT